MTSICRFAPGAKARTRNNESWPCPISPMRYPVGKVILSNGLSGRFMELLSQIWNSLWPPTAEKFAALVTVMGPWFYVLLFAIVFCETGLVVTPVLPGDSLLFAAGAVAANPDTGLSLPLLIVLLIAAA